MPSPSVPLEQLGFLTIGTFDGADPGPGHQTTLQVIELGERLGFDSAWVRHRHLQHGISSPVAVLAAASQRTRRIALGTAVTPLGWENPLRLAEDLATVDVLSGGRLNPGISVGPPMQLDDVKDALYPDTAAAEDFGYERAARLLRLVGGEPASTFRGVRGIEEFSDRVQPHSPGLQRRMWYGGASLRSARWAGEHGMNLLTSSVVKAEESDDFAAVQRSHIDAFRASHQAGAAARVSQGLVVIPTDSATAAQRERYAAYVAARTPRTTSPQGPARLLFAPDLLGTSAQIAETLYAHAGFLGVSEVAFALPFSFEPDDYVQILTDIATQLGPALGWAPSQPADDLRAAEHRLQQAMLAGDAEALEVLLAPDVVYVGPDGRPVSRDADLAAHRTGALRLNDVRELELDVVERGDTGVTRALLALAGTAQGQDFAVTYRYTRSWHRSTSGWQVLSAHASAVAAEAARGEAP